MVLVTNGRLITRDSEGKGYYEHGAVAYEGTKIVEVGEEAALRAKYTQHKDLAKALLATDGRIEYANGIDGFWTSYRGGRNWIGRLLELVRAELRARR